MKIFDRMKIRKLEKTIERYPSVADNYLQLAKLHHEIDEVTEAEQRLRQLLALDVTPEQKAEAYLLLATILAASERNEEARTTLDQAAIDDAPILSRGRMRLLLGELLLASFQQLPLSPQRTETRNQAITSLEQAAKELRTDPELWKAWAGLIELYEDADEPTKIKQALLALERLAGSIKNPPLKKDQIHLKLARLLEEDLNDRDEAYRYYERITESLELEDNELALVFYRMGAIKQQKDDPVGAIEQFEMALRYYGKQATPDVARVQYELGLLYHESGRYAQALKEIERAVATPGLDQELSYELASWLATYYVEQQEPQKAYDHASVALEFAPTEADVLDLLERRGSILEKLTRTEDAITDYTRFLEQASPMRAAKVNARMAALYFQTKRYDEALRYAVPALDYRPNPQLLYLIGAIKWERKEVLESLRHLLRLCDEFRSAEERGDAMKLLRLIRQELRAPEQLAAYKLSEGDLEELDQLLEAVGEETDIIRRLRKGLAKTQMGLVGSIERLLSGRADIDDELLDELSDILLLADLGVETTTMVIEEIRAKVNARELRDPAKIKKLIRDKLEQILNEYSGDLTLADEKPSVVMMVGVNGVGKTTTIAKLAKRFIDNGSSVLLAAGDTFRAGAIEQLEEWGRRVGVEVVKQGAGSDPSAVAYDAVAAAQSRGIDCLIVDTAGRLHTKINLMEELKKVRRVIDKKLPGAPHEILLVVDATTGQNAINQADLFHKAVGVTGVVLTKMDGTAKGGIIVRIVHELKIPVKFIGIGEGMDDLRPFSPKDFVTALFG